MKILEDIRGVAKPTQLCALLPFFKGDQVDNFSMSSAGKIYGRVLALILLVTSVIFCEDVLFASQGYKLIANSQGDTEDINRTIETLFCISSYTIIVVSSVLNASKHYRTIRDLSKLDAYLESHGYVASYSCKFLGTLLVFASSSVVMVAFYYIHYLSEIASSRQFILMLIYSLQMIYSCMFALYLRTILKCLAQRIEFLNERLDQFTLKRKQLYDKDDWCELSNLIEVLCKFRYITENMNSVTGVALLFFFGFSFYTVTNQSYLAFATLTTPTKLRKQYDTMGLSCAWVLAETAIMAVICSSFDCLASECPVSAMSPNTWVIQMATHKSRLNPHRRISPHRVPLFNDAFARPPTTEPILEMPVESPVFEDISTILSVLKATGLLPIYEQVSSYEVAPPTRTNEFYSFFVRGVVHALTIFNIYSLLTPNAAQLFHSLRETDNVNQWIELLLCIITYTLTVFVCARNTKSILQIMNDILKLDQEVLRQFGVALSNHCNFSIKFLVVIVCCQAYILVLRFNSVEGTITPTTYVLIGFYALQNGLTATYIVFASALLRIVCIRFHFVNQLLNGYTYGQQRGKSRQQIQTHMASFPDESLFIYRTHNRLLRIYKSINECCSLIIVCFLGYSFYTVTTNWYNLFVQITNNKGVISAEIMQWCLAWLCLHTSLLTLLSRSCGATTYEANTTSQILARVYGKSKEFQNIIDKFLTKSIKQEVQFTAYGFFAIDNSTLFKIFSAVTTYLVILIQFKQLEDSKFEEEGLGET